MYEILLGKSYVIYEMLLREPCVCVCDMGTCV